MSRISADHTPTGRQSQALDLLPADDAERLHQLRLMLEPPLAGMAAERMTPLELAALRGVLDRFCEVVVDRPQEAGQLYADFHLAIYESSRSQLTAVVRGYWSRLSRRLPARVDTAELVREHAEILAALESRAPALAAERVRRLITDGRDGLAAAGGGRSEERGPAGGHLVRAC